jgi:hypothetical protein
MRTVTGFVMSIWDTRPIRSRSIVLVRLYRGARLVQIANQPHVGQPRSAASCRQSALCVSYAWSLGDAASGRCVPRSDAYGSRDAHSRIPADADLADSGNVAFAVSVAVVVGVVVVDVVVTLGISLPSDASIEFAVARSPSR